jgi:hypothetical protein
MDSLLAGIGKELAAHFGPVISALAVDRSTQGVGHGAHDIAMAKRCLEDVLSNS